MLTPERIIEEKMYTFADAFCGAGGMSLGARDAGLRIRWAFDHNQFAMETYTDNHGRDVGLQMPAEDFEVKASENAEGQFKVDLSPPCSGFSRANRGLPKVPVRTNACTTHVGASLQKVI